MYKLLLVDDEEEVRKGIIEKINWREHGFDIPGEAENGVEALEIAEKMVPDVVITDIKMPFMDGMKLSGVLREKYPNIKIVVLTGFDEFEYAQKAIKMDIVEYVLKPISSSELAEVLVRIKNLIDKEIAERKNIEVLRDYYDRSLPILKEKFLISLITGKLRTRQIFEKAEDYGINLSGKSFVVSVTKLGGGSEREKPHESNSTLEEEGLIIFGALNIFEEIIKKRGLGTVFLHNDLIVVISRSQETGKEDIISSTFKVLEEAHQSLEKFLKLRVTTGLGSVCEEVKLISHSYKNALSALDYRLIMKGNKIIWIEDMEPKLREKIVFDEFKERQLVSSVKVGTEEDVKNTMDKLFQEIADSKTSFKDYQIYLLEIVITVLKVAKGLNVDIGEILGENYNLYVELYKLNDIREVRNWIEGICIGVMNYITKGRQDSSKLLVEKAKEFVERNYHDVHLGIESVCSYLHISPTYFSSIFKKETKLTFINYLTQIRMEAAKELLRTTCMKSFEIAERVGYSEPNYFSYCFKRNFSISPSEYRNKFKVGLQ